MKMKNICNAVEAIDRFINCNPEGKEGLGYARHNLREMFLKAMHNLDVKEDGDRIGLITESFLFLDDLLEKLQVVSPEEIEDLQELIRSSN